MDTVRMTTSQHGPNTAPVSLGDLVASIRGRIVPPTDPEWDVGRQPWNLTVDEKPALVAMPRDLEDVRAIVQHAGRHRTRRIRSCSAAAVDGRGVRHLGGALSRVADGAGALGSLRGDYLFFAGGVVGDSSLEVDAALVRLRAATAAYETGSLYPNFTERPADSSCFYPEADYARLQRIRARVDPHELMVASHPIGSKEAQP